MTFGWLKHREGFRVGDFTRRRNKKSTGKKQDKHHTRRFCCCSRAQKLSYTCKNFQGAYLQTSTSEGEGIGVLLISKFLSVSYTWEGTLCDDGIGGGQRRKERVQSLDCIAECPSDFWGSLAVHRLATSPVLLLQLYTVKICRLAPRKEFNPGWKAFPRNLDLLPAGLLESSLNSTFQL